MRKLKSQSSVKHITIKDFALQISPLEDISLENKIHNQFLYENNKFWENQGSRQGPHSVNTFYKKKQKKNQFFFGDEFSKKQFNKMESISQSQVLTVTNLTESQLSQQTQSHLSVHTESQLSQKSQMVESTGKFIQHEGN